MSDADHTPNEPIEESVRMIDELIDRGHTRKAERVLVEAMVEALPSQPLRFSVILTRPSERIARLLASDLAAGLKPRLALDERDHDEVLVVWGSEVVGQIPKSTLEPLRQAEADLAVYQPRLLEIDLEGTERATVVAIELVRPALRRCSSCGTLHPDPHVNCAECRSKRRRKGEEHYEAPPVPLQARLDEIA